VRGYGEAFRGMLLRDARALMAADLSIRTFELPNDAQLAAMKQLERRGAIRTWITETVSMISGSASADSSGYPILVSIKAVEPGLYPFYGELRLDPPGRLRDRLTPETIVVSQDLLLRLGKSVGDSVRLGEASYRIAGVVVTEPDRMTGSLNVGPRLMISRDGLERSNLLVPGSRASQRFLFKLPENGIGIAEARGILRRGFQAGLIADYRETHPLITRGLDRATTFLSLVSLVSLIVGALGVATAMHSHLQQRMDSIAVMKCLGARSSQIIRIYLLQTLMLGLAGALLGALLGLAVQAAFPSLLARYFPVRPGIRLDLLSSVQGLGVGLLTTVLFTWPPLAAIRQIRPAMILRRDMPEAGPNWRERRRRYGRAGAGVAIIAAGLALLAASLAGGDPAHAARIGAWFAGGLLVSLLVLTAFGKLALVALRELLRRLPVRTPPSIRHGFANLYRPGNQAPFVIGALGVGVVFTLTVFLVQHSMLEQMFRAAPRGMPNVFLINVTERERAGLVELLRQQAGIESPPELVLAASAKLETVDGVPVAKRTQREGSRRFQRARSVTTALEKPQGASIINGAWWNGKPAVNEVSVTEEAANILALRPGSNLEFTAAGRRINAKIAAIHRIDSVRPGSGIEFIFSPGTLEGLPATYFGTVKVRPKDVPALQRAAWKRYPTVTVINAADVLQIVQEVVDQIALVVRFVSLFAVLAGAVVLASSVASTRFRRVREMAILKALGATRGRLTRIYSIELLVLGGLAGVIGSALASSFSALLLKSLFDSEFRFDLTPNLIAVASTAVLALAAGWLAGYRHFAQKPLEVLRGE
jgi:putative ABC transport system permease protein